MSIPIIGGKADGTETTRRDVVLKLNGETYLRVESKEKGAWYQLAGMTPVEAMKRL